MKKYDAAVRLNLAKPIRGILLGSLMAILANQAFAGFITFEAAGTTPSSITAARDAFRAAVGGGTVAGANGDFGGLRREINWDAVPGSATDPNLMPADFFNTTSPRGAVFSTPGTGFLVSANAGGATPILFGFPNDFQVFSPQKLFTAVNSNITDVSFFLPGTTTAATTSAFGVIFVDVETANSSRIDFLDVNNQLLFSRSAMIAGNQGLSFVGGVADSGEQISRVRITSGANTIVSNGVLGDQVTDIVVTDDFLFATPREATTATPEPASFGLLGFGALAFGLARKALGRGGNSSRIKS